MKAHPASIFVLILALEAIFSLLPIAKIQALVFITEGLGAVVPVVSNFMANVAATQNVAPYVALTCLLMPLKVFAAYLIILRLSPEDKRLVLHFPSSDAAIGRRIFSSTLLFLLTIGAAWYVFSYGDSYFGSTDAPRSANLKYHLVAEGGIGMWLGWPLMHLTPASFLFGLFVAFIVEWFQLIK